VLCRRSTRRRIGIAVFVFLVGTAALGGASPGRVDYVDYAYWTARGRLVTFWDGNHLWLMRANGTQTRRVAAFPEDGIGASSVSPSGQLVATSTVYGPRADRGLLVVRRVGARSPIARFRLGNLPTEALSEPAWAPDEKALATEVFVSGATVRSHIFVANLSRRSVRDVSRSTSRDDESPAWSPNGRQVAFLGCGSTRESCDLLLIGRQGSRRRAVLRSIDPQRFSFPATPAWAPDGRTIALVLRTPGANPEVPQRYLIETVRLDQRRPRLIATTASTRVFRIPIAWSPDGRELAFSDASGLWAVNVATHKKRLLRSSGRNPDGWAFGAVSWAPSRRILFTHRGDIYTLIPGRRPVKILG
jgi:Tol biopolymer transport system component